MKFWRITAAVLLISSLAGCLILANVLSREVPRGQITITDVSGDRSAMAGILVNGRTGFRDGDSWRGSISPDQGTSRIEYLRTQTTTFDLYEDYFDDNPAVNVNAELYCGMVDGNGTNLLEQWQGIDSYMGFSLEMIREAADAVAPGTRRVVRLHPEEYGTVCPVLSLSWDSEVPENQIWGYSGEWGQWEYLALAELLEIPWPKEVPLDLTIEKDESGGVAYMEFAHGQLTLNFFSASDEQDTLYMITDPLLQGPDGTWEEIPGDHSRRVLAVDLALLREFFWGRESREPVSLSDLGLGQTRERIREAVTIGPKLPENYRPDSLSCEPGGDSLKIWCNTPEGMALLVCDGDTLEVKESLALTDEPDSSPLGYGILHRKLENAELAAEGDHLVVLRTGEEELPELWGSFLLPGRDTLPMDWAAEEPGCEAVDPEASKGEPWLQHSKSCTDAIFDGDRLVLLEPLSHRTECGWWSQQLDATTRWLDSAEVLVYGQEGLRYHGIITFDIPGARTLEQRGWGPLFQLEEIG